MATYLVKTTQPFWLPTVDSSKVQLPGMVPYSDQDYRRMIQDVVGPGSGIINLGDLAVTASATPDGQVHIGTGRYRIAGNNSATEGTYIGGVDSAVALDSYPADSVKDRIDTVIQQVDNDTPHTTWQGQTTWVIGTLPTSGPPVAPAVPIDAIAIANVYRTAGSTTVTNANITNVAQYAALMVPTIQLTQQVPQVVGSVPQKIYGSSPAAVGTLTIPVPAGAQVVEVTGQVKSSVVGTLRMTFNGDVGTHYFYEDLLGTGSTDSAFSNVNLAYIAVADLSGDVNYTWFRARIVILAPNQIGAEVHSGSGYYSPSAGPRVHAIEGAYIPATVSALTSITLVPWGGTMTGGIVAYTL